MTVAPRRLAWTNARQSYPVRVAHVLSVNLARVRANPDPRAQSKLTGIDKVAASEAVMVRAPGSMHAGVGSGLVGDTSATRSSMAVMIRPSMRMREKTSTRGKPSFTAPFTTECSARI